MSDWAYSQITIYSKNKPEILDLHSKLTRWLSEPTLKPDAWKGRSDWLGNILLHAGLDWKKENCTGYIDALEDEIVNINGYNCISFNTDTIWTPLTAMWCKILAKLYPDTDIRLAYIGEEMNNCLYQKWDPDNLFYPEDYYIDCGKEGVPDDKLIPTIKILFEDDDYVNTCVSRDIAVRYMQDLLSTDETDEDVLLNRLDDFNEDFEVLGTNSFIHFHKYDIVKPEKH